MIFSQLGVVTDRVYLYPEHLICITNSDVFFSPTSSKHFDHAINPWSSLSTPSFRGAQSHISPRPHPASHAQPTKISQRNDATLNARLVQTPRLVRERTPSVVCAIFNVIDRSERNENMQSPNRVVIVTGAGRLFSAGADLKAFVHDLSESVHLMMRMLIFFLVLFPKKIFFFLKFI